MAGALPLTTVEPVAGYQQVTSDTPSPHSVNRWVYGGRFTAGILYFAVEGEYLHGSVNETFGLLSQKDTVDSVKLGLRTTIPVYGIFQAFLRGGGQISRDVIAQSTAGALVSTIDTPVVYCPYFGLGIRAHFFRYVALTAGITTIFHNFPSWNTNDYEATGSLAFEIP
jgi:hypothetical protein